MFGLTVMEIVGIAAGIVVAIGIVMALLTPAGRDAFALLGLRVADALTSWLEGRLSAPKQVARANARLHQER